jgi:5-hydroxyisourate hydrolase
MTISTHVLDASLGRPGVGVELTLARWSDDGSWTTLSTGSTNDDGRCPELAADLDVGIGVYRLSFGTGDYFARVGTETFYPVVELTFGVTDPGAHYHVPLLLSPFAFSTYRGS